MPSPDWNFPVAHALQSPENPNCALYVPAVQLMQAVMLLPELSLLYLPVKQLLQYSCACSA
jgi:hypothetical protein